MVQLNSWRVQLNSWREQGHGLVDLRSNEQFSVIHLINATNVPADSFIDRMQELPEKGEPLVLLGAPQDLKTIKELSGDYTIIAEFVDEPLLWNYAKEKGWTEAGDKSKRLWKPCPFLEEVIDRIEKEVPKGEFSAIDIACGSGRDAIYLSGRGWNVVGVDNVELRLNKLKEVSQREKCAVTTLCLDLEPDIALDLGTNEPDWEGLRSKLLSVCPGGYNLVHVARYLHRPLMPILRDLVKSGGFVVYHTFMVPSLGRPRRPRFLLNPSELVEIFADFKVIEFREDKFPDGRPAQYLCAQKP